MKKITFLICTILIVCITTVRSQTDKGTFLIGVSTSSNLGSIGYSSINYRTNDKDVISKSNRTSLNLSPKFGYFIIDNLALGIDVSLTYSYLRQKAIDETSKKFDYILAPFVRYYFPSKKIIPFIELQGGYAALSNKYSIGISNINDNNSSFYFSGGPGIAFPLSDNVTFDALIEYGYSLNQQKNNTQIISEGIGANFGFIIFLKSKKNQ